jgi:curli biogenesis system outer membrane secretion channel CsgG
MCRKLPFAGALLALLLAGCDKTTESVSQTPAPPPPVAAEPAPIRTYDYSQKVLSGAKQRQGLRWTVAVLRYGDTKPVEDAPYGQATQPAQSGQVNVNVKIGNDAGSEPSQVAPWLSKNEHEMLKRALVQSEAFAVVERERILELLREINFGQSRYVDPDTSPEMGQMLAVRYVIEATICRNQDRSLKGHVEVEGNYKDLNEYEPNFRQNMYENRKRLNKERFGAMLEKKEKNASRGRQRILASTACYLSIYEVRTGEVVSAIMGLGANSSEAINEAVEDLIVDLGEKQPDPYVAAVSGEKIYLDVGAGSGLKVGDSFAVVRADAPVRDRDGNIIGRQETEVGEIEVTEIAPTMCVAKVVHKVADVSRGDIARPAKH